MIQNVNKMRGNIKRGKDSTNWKLSTPFAHTVVKLPRDPTKMNNIQIRHQVNNSTNEPLSLPVGFERVCIDQTLDHHFSI